MGCDKTTPALLMGAASCDLPTIGVSGGPMLSGQFRGKQIGSGTGVWQMSEDVRAGKMSQEEFTAAESCMHRSKGHCMTMGTASTMASLVEALGVSLPGNAAIPAVDSRRYRQAQLTGRRIVEMVEEDLALSRILTRAAFENAIRVNAAIGGSTNSVIHLLAIAGRVGVPLSLDDWDRLGSALPCLVDLQPSGKYLMEDFYYAGGLPAVMREIKHVLDGSALTVNGKTLGDNIADAPCWNRDVIRAFDAPFKPAAGIAVLRGNLAPDGAVIKPSAASPHLLQHRGRAVVFESIEDFHARIDDENLDIDEHCVMVLKGCGPKGYPGMAEVGNMPLPPKLLRRGITDILRISDARMSGTAYGSVVLHVSPEAAAGGPLALVRNGDMIEVDVPGRRLHLDVAPPNSRRTRLAARASPRGCTLYVDHGSGAPRRRSGCSIGKRTAPVTRDSVRNQSRQRGADLGTFGGPDSAASTPGHLALRDQSAAPAGEHDDERGRGVALIAAATLLPSTRHAEIRDDHRIGFACGVGRDEGVDAGLAAVCRRDFVTIVLERVAHRFEQHRVVVDDQDFHRPNRRLVAAARNGRLGLRGDEYQAHQGAPVGFAFHFQCRAVTLCHPVDHGEAQASTASALGGEEGFETTPLGFLVHADAVVDDLENDRRSAGR
jgi:dihydroxy-acid dehydratase